MPREPLQPPTNPRQHVGKTLARCVVGEPLGYGRTSWVYRAHYEPLDREIALKILSGDLAGEAELRARFISEARAIAQVDHENVVRVYDVVEDEDAEICILMELIPGETLHERIKRDGALPVKKALRIALEIARALEAAHAAGVVHRDVKPPNVMLVTGSDQVKVLDFGLAGSGTKTRIGTPLYMSPEACQGKRIDEKSDVYALGVCLYKMLTGELPYTGDTVKEILAAHIAGKLVLPSKVAPDLGTAYDDVVKKLLVSAKGYRPTAAGAVELLRPHVETRDDGTGARGGGRRRRGGGSRRPGQSNKTGMIVGVVGLVVVLAVAVVFLLNARGKDGGTGSGQAPPVPANGTGGGVTPSGTGGGVTPPPTPPVVPTVDPRLKVARTAYEEAERWAAANSADLAGAVLHWERVAIDHAGTEWGDKAGEQLTRAKQRVTEAAEAKERDAERNAAAQRTVEQRKELDAAILRCDFDEAARIAATHTSVPGETIQEWRAKFRRIDLLKAEFIQRLNENLETTQIMAEVVKDDAGHDEVLVSADAKGLSTKAGDLPRRVEWVHVKPDNVFKLFKKFTSQRTVDDNVFLAVLACELGLARDSAMHREVALMVDARGDAKERFRPYFVDP